MIELKGVTKRFDDKLILDGVDIALPAPGMTALLGASGIGKTTLGRMLLGLDADYTGTITGVPPRCASVFQEDRLLMQLTAEENVRFVSPHISADRLREGFDRLGIAADMHTPVSQLSGGMKRRVSVLRALLSDGQLVVMDEAMKGLDGAIARQTAAYIREQMQGRTLLYITHAGEEIEWLGIETVLRLDDGKIHKITR